MRSRKWNRLLITVAIGGSLAMGGVGLTRAAITHTRNQTAAVTGTFTATLTALRSVTCTGLDGPYRYNVATYTGTATSSDPSLSGRLILNTYNLTSVTSGYGQTTGRVTIASRTTGRPTFTGTFNAVVVGFGSLSGFVTGYASASTSSTPATRVPAAFPAGRLFAPFGAQATNAQGTALAGVIGGNAQTQAAPGVIQSGTSCS